MDNFIIFLGRNDLTHLIERDVEVSAGGDDVKLVHIPAGIVVVMVVRVDVIGCHKSCFGVKVQGVFGNASDFADFTDLVIFFFQAGSSVFVG